MDEVYQHLEACKRILDEWEEEEKHQYDLGYSEGINGEGHEDGALSTARNRGRDAGSEMGHWQDCKQLKW